MDFKKLVIDSLECDMDKNAVYSALAFTDDDKNGDVCLPCFKFSKELKKSPAAIAADFAAAFKQSVYIEKCAVAGGYLNFYLDKKAITEAVFAELENKGENYAPHQLNGKTVCVDYSSINIAKPFHIGHLLTTVIGASICRIYKYLGYNVVGINHLGDWGTQFGKLIVAYLKWGNDEDIEKRSVNALLDLYVRFHKEAEKDESLNEEARAWFKKIEDGDSKALAIFEKFKVITLEEVGKIYDLLGITFDSYAGESFYNDKMQPIIDNLKSKNLLTQSEGAEVVDLSAQGMPPCLILKSDGATLYATRDLAAAVYRKKTYDFYKNIYVVAYQQNLHFKQFFAVLKLMGYSWADDCIHVPFGMVSLEGTGALSTREGNVVFLKDVLNTAVHKVRAVIDEKSPDLENKDKVAEDVGVGAVVFGALSNNRIKDMVFSYDKALNFDGETGPYLQYTHARCASLIKKAGEINGKYDFDAVSQAFDLVKLLNNYENVVADAADKYEPSLVSRYLLDLAKAFNKFYLNGRVIGEAPDTAFTRLKLISFVKSALKNGMQLILLKAPDKM